MELTFNDSIYKVVRDLMNFNSFGCSLKCKIPTSGRITIFGGFLIHFTLGLVYSYGNMVPYIISFSRVHSLDPNKKMVMVNASPWINSCGMLGEGIFMNERLGFRL